MLTDAAVNAIAEKKGRDHFAAALDHTERTMKRLKLPVDSTSLSFKIQHAITMAYMEGAIRVVRQHVARMNGNHLVDQREP